jgi:hypothetical protein
MSCGSSILQGHGSMIANGWILSEASPFQLQLHREIRNARQVSRASKPGAASGGWKKMRALLRT